MDTNEKVFLQVPITERERRQLRDDSHDRLLNELPRQHGRDSSFNQRVGRFKSLRTPEQRGNESLYDPPEQDIPRRPSSKLKEDANVVVLPSADETSYQPQPIIPVNNGHQSTRAPPPLWKPFWLDRWVLVLYVLMFLAFLAALLVLRHFSDANQGFRVAEGTSHYTWTYGPTAVMVIVVALWRPVDYYCKLLVPWDQLRKGPVSPERSLLVDYISPFQVISFFAAFKRGHLPVIISILVFFITKLLTIASTALFILRPATFNIDNVTLSSLATFDSSLYDPTNLSISTTSSSVPVLAFYGNVSNGLPYPPGITNDYAYNVPILNTTALGLPSNTTFLAEVDLFLPDLSCEIVNVTLDVPKVMRPTNLTYNSTTRPYGPGNLGAVLPEGKICDHWLPITIGALDPSRYKVPNRQIRGGLQAVECATAVNGTSDGQGPRALLYTLTDINYTQILLTNTSRAEGGARPIALNSSRVIGRMVNLLCQPSYAIGRANITKDGSYADSMGLSVVPLVTTPNKTLNGFSVWNLTTAFVESLNATRDLFGQAAQIPRDTRVPSTVFSIMASTEQTSNYEILFEEQKLQNSARTMFQGVMSNFASKNLTSPGQSTTSIDNKALSATYSENRLTLNRVSLLFMTSAFAALAALTGVLVFMAPAAVVPRDPSTIATTALILCRSTELNRLLRKQPVPRNDNIAATLDGFTVGTALASTDSDSPSFKVVVSSGSQHSALEKKQSSLKWWVPLTASIPVVILIMLALAMTVVALELLQLQSDGNGGLADVWDDNSTLFASHFLPALVMLILASFINTLDFNIALFSPWSRLATGDAKADSTLFSNLLGSLPPGAFIEAVRTRYLGAVLSIIACVAASGLTVLVSGLFTVQKFETTGPGQSVSEVSQWNLKAPYSALNDNGAATVVNMLDHYNYNYPDSTWDELALPKLSRGGLVNQPGSLSVITGRTNGVVPALRGNLRCDVLSRSSFNVTIQKYEYYNETKNIRVEARYDLPQSCHLGGASGNESFVDFRVDLDPANGTSVFVGKQFDLLFGANSTLHGNFGEANTGMVGNNPPVGCPSLAFIFGQISSDSNDNDLVTVATCYQEIQQVGANITLLQDSVQIDPSHYPVVIESSVQTLINPNSKNEAKSFDFRIQNNLYRQLDSYNTSEISPSNSSIPTTHIDVFFQAVINGSQPHDPLTLLGQANQQALLDAVNHSYRRYMAQLYNAILRSPISSDPQSSIKSRQTPSAALPNLQTSISTPRLVQHRSSTLALQILLGVMILFSSFGYLLTKTRRILPCNPCSIAGKMSLLMGSDLCWSPDDGICACCGKPRRDSNGIVSHIGVETIHADADHEDAEDDRSQVIRSGAEWMSNEYFHRVFAGADQRYSLGWWGENRRLGKRRRFGIDIGTQADDHDEGDWYLGKRRVPTGEDNFEDFMTESRSKSSSRMGLIRNRSMFARGNRSAASSRTGGRSEFEDDGDRGVYSRAERSFDGAEEHEMNAIMSGGRGIGREALYDEGGRGHGAGGEA